VNCIYLLSSFRNWDTELFLSIISSQATYLPDPDEILKGFPVTSMQFRKTTSEHDPHEFLTFQVFQDKRYEYILKRNDHSSPPDDATVDQFLNHPDSRNLLDTILEAFRLIHPSTTAVAATTLALGHASIPAVSSQPL
jgi:hypothetical protein